MAEIQVQIQVVTNLITASGVANSIIGGGGGGAHIPIFMFCKINFV